MLLPGAVPGMKYLLPEMKHRSIHGRWVAQGHPLQGTSPGKRFNINVLPLPNTTVNGSFEVDAARDAGGHVGPSRVEQAVS